MTDDVIDRARAWHDMDPDPVTRAELADLMADAAAGVAEATTELHDRFDTRLAFGTAGLRGRLAAGPNRMNRVLVAQAAAGLAAWLAERADGHPTVVIGYDGRVNSDVFARDSAELVAGAGLRAILLPRPMPTPVLAFAVRHLDAAAGVMVTASHNPPRDNGYKVYLGGEDRGSQIVPPVDGEIAAHILRVADETPVGSLPRSYDYEVAGDEVLDAYVAATAAAVGGAGGADLRVVFSAMHGVGWESLARVFGALGMSEPVTVPAQIEPDGAFPTVAFPNPEEPGAMDLSFALAREVDADLVIVNDPDADRLAVGIPDSAAPSGWRRLTGNEVGGLLGWECAERARSAGRSSGVLAASIVSSPLLAEIARDHGFGFAETLTGFKWVSRVPDLVYGFEEALGYLVDPGVVRDKDGVSAAALVVASARRWAGDGQTVRDRLDAMADRFGAFASGQIAVRVTDLSRIGALMSALRADPPAELAGTPVARVDDLADGSPDLPPSDVLRLVLADGSRVMVRPSGTEPKLKAYLDTASLEGSPVERRARADARLADLTVAVSALLGV